MTRIWLVLGAWTIGAALGLGAWAAAACELTVGWDAYAPYTFADEDGNATGADTDLITAIARDIGCRLEFAELPWARVVREVENGSLDMTTSSSWTEERSAWAQFSEPYRQTEMAIYVRSGESRRFDLESLADIPRQQFRLGVIIDYFYGEELTELTTDPDFARWIEGATDYPTNIRKLVGGRIDGFIAEDVVVMAAELERLGLADRVERLPMPIAGEELRFMFSRRTVDPATVAEVDDAIARMRADGRLDAIMAEYLR